MLSEREKQLVKSQVQTYDSLMDQSSFAQEKKAEGEIQGLQKMALEAVEDQYPALLELAQERIALIRQPDLLRQLVKQIFKAHDEAMARWVLNTFTSS